MRPVVFVALVLAGCAGDLTGSSMPVQDADNPANGDGPRWADAPSGTNTAGTLRVTATSSPNGGQYAPRNVVAIWVVGPSGSFVRTIGRWADVRKQHLVAWGTASGGDADAVSGATRQDHNTQLVATWDLKLAGGQQVGDGMYTVRMESADMNSNLASQNHQGTFTFAKSPTAQMQTNLSNGGFSNVSITFTPN